MEQVQCLDFWLVLLDLLVDPVKRLPKRLLSKLQERWESVLQLNWDKRRVEYRSEELKERVQLAFSVPRPGWILAQYHSPDVMIAASSIEAIQRGEYLLVLGEVHVATNTLRYSFMVAQHPKPDELFHALQQDFPCPRPIPVPPRHWPKLTNRTSMALIAPEDYSVETSVNAPSHRPHNVVMSLSDFVLKGSPAGLMVHSRDGRLSFDVIGIFWGDSVRCKRGIPENPRFSPAYAAGYHRPHGRLPRVVVFRCRRSPVRAAAGGARSLSRSPALDAVSGPAPFCLR